MSTRPLFKATDPELIEKFHKVEDFHALADLLEFNAHGLERIFYDIKRLEKHYQEFSIKKKSGGERQIFAPDNKLKFIQRRLAYVLSLIYLGRISVHGFRCGKSIITNAERHVRRRSLLNIDLDNFFPTIHFGRVRGILQMRPYCLSKSGATIIAGFCCYKSKLPQGAPTSPIISNIICSKLDSELQRLAYEERCTYSRYADDIVFSTTRRSFSENMVKMEKDEWRVGEKLNQIITNNVFMVNQKKIRVRFYTERQEVTGLIVNKFPNVKRNFIKNVRMMLHMWKKFGIENVSKQYIKKYGVDFYRSLQGKINFIKLIKTKEDSTYRTLAEKFNNLSGEPIFEIIPIRNWPEEEFIAAGERYKGINFLKGVFSMADKEIFILDNYLDGDIVSFIEEQINKKQSLLIKLLISQESPKRYKNCINTLKKFAELHPGVQIDCREGLPKQPGGLHGRFIVIDGVGIYQSGHSLAQLGEKGDRISRIRIQSTKNDALINFESLFSGATKISLIP